MKAVRLKSSGQSVGRRMIYGGKNLCTSTCCIWLHEYRSAAMQGLLHTTASLTHMSPLAAVPPLSCMDQWAACAITSLSMSCYKCRLDRLQTLINQYLHRRHRRVYQSFTNIIDRVYLRMCSTHVYTIRWNKLRMLKNGDAQRYAFSSWFNASYHNVRVKRKWEAGQSTVWISN